jgi:hypothetical protein
MSVALGVAVIIFAQMFIDWYRARNKAVPREDFEYLEQIVGKIKSVVEIQTGITINGVDYRGKRKNPPGHSRDNEEG